MTFDDACAPSSGCNQCMRKTVNLKKKKKHGHGRTGRTMSYGPIVMLGGIHIEMVYGARWETTWKIQDGQLP